MTRLNRCDSNKGMNDITTKDDVRLLVDSFYASVKEDDLLAPVFSGLDWPHHLPIMYNFWSSILLGDQSYQGNPLQKHMPLKIDTSHFERWLSLFSETVDKLFKGDVADEAKNRAANVARLFQHKMGLMK